MVMKVIFYLLYFVVIVITAITLATHIPFKDYVIVMLCLYGAFISGISICSVKDK
jgi:hypothetical protein